MNELGKSQNAHGRKISHGFSVAPVWVLGLALLPLSTGLCYASSKPVVDAEAMRIAKLSPEIKGRAAGPDELVTVIVQYRDMPSASSLKTLQANGGAIKSRLSSIHSVTMRIPASMLETLSRDANVTYITPDRAIQMANVVQENVEAEDAIEANVAVSQYAFYGTGIGVAVIDSGISDHPDLHGANGNSRVVYNQSFVVGDSSTQDKYGHGTHVAGLLGSNGSSSLPGSGYPTTYYGMAGNVNLINLRVLDQNGIGTDSQVIAAIEQAIALKNTYNIRVINMSLGRPVFESYTLDPVDRAVEAAWKAGIVVVVAAGNGGRDNSARTEGFATISVPANDPAVITVGATRTADTDTRVDDTIASYSSKGPTLIDHIVKPDLVAPGNHLVSLRAAGSTLDRLYPQFQVAPAGGTARYFLLSGTSMSTPVVSGAVALMLQQNSALTPDQVKARLMKTAWKGFGQYSQSSDTSGNIYSNEYDIFTYGAGYLDLDAVLSNTDVAAGIALSPTAIYNARNGTVSIANTSSSSFGGTSVVWGANSIVWGTSVVWGANTILGESVVWGANSVVWGATSVEGFSVVWGANSTLGTTVGSLNSGADGDN